MHFIVCLPSVSNDGNSKEKAIQAIWTPQLASEVSLKLTVASIFEY